MLANGSLARQVEAFPKCRLVEAAITFVRLSRLHGNFFQLPPHFDISFKETRFVIVNSVLLADRLHEISCSAEVVPRKPRVQVMLDLKLKPNVKVVKPLWSGDVHGGPFEENGGGRGRENEKKRLL